MYGRSWILVLGLTATTAGSAMAQPMAGVPAPKPPVFSPYLNLARRDSSPTLNYFGLVRPQIAARSSLQSLQQQLLQQGQQQIAAQPVVNPDLPVTGQQAVFLNTGGYFLNSRTGVGPVSGMYTTRRGPPQPIQPASASLRPRLR